MLQESKSVETKLPRELFYSHFSYKATNPAQTQTNLTTMASSTLPLQRLTLEAITHLRTKYSNEGFAIKERIDNRGVELKRRGITIHGNPTSVYSCIYFDSLASGCVVGIPRASLEQEEGSGSSLEGSASAGQRRKRPVSASPRWPEGL